MPAPSPRTTTLCDLAPNPRENAAEAAFAIAQMHAVFDNVLPELCREIDMLRTPLPSTLPRGRIARAMYRAVAPHAGGSAGACGRAHPGEQITPMAAVAGAVADFLLAALLHGRAILRAFVNNGGDIAIFLAPGATLRVGIVPDIARPSREATLVVSRSCGVATSGRACKGRGGRSFSFGIADAVTVVARTAAEADAAATVIANAVDLPGDPAIARRPACDIDPDTDLGARLITWDVGALSCSRIDAALDAGRRRADALRDAGLIEGAVLALRGRIVATGDAVAALEAA